VIYENRKRKKKQERENNSICQKQIYCNPTIIANYNSLLLPQAPAPISPGAAQSVNAPDVTPVSPSPALSDFALTDTK